MHSCRAVFSLERVPLIILFVFAQAVAVVVLVVVAVEAHVAVAVMRRRSGIHALVSVVWLKMVYYVIDPCLFIV